MFGGLVGEFSIEQLTEMTRLGGGLVCNQGGIYQSLCCTTEEMGTLWPHVLLVQHHAHMFPDLAPRLLHISQQ